jgi:hypothetical protein
MLRKTNALKALGTLLIAISVLLSCQLFVGAQSSTQNAQKPLVLYICDPRCTSWDPEVRAAIKRLKDEYKDRITFAEMEVAKLGSPEIKLQAKTLGVEKFLPDLVSYAPVVVICSSDRKVSREFVGPIDQKVYRPIIEQFLSRKDPESQNKNSLEPVK